MAHMVLRLHPVNVTQRNAAGAGQSHTTGHAGFLLEPLRNLKEPIRNPSAVVPVCYVLSCLWEEVTSAGDAVVFAVPKEPSKCHSPQLSPTVGLRQPLFALGSAPSVFAFSGQPALSKQRRGRDKQLAGRASAGSNPTAASPCSPRCGLGNDGSSLSWEAAG